MNDACPSCPTKCCPIAYAVGVIGRKWSLNILRDLFIGKKHFSQFLESSKDLSTKMLSARLKDLQKAGLVAKKIVEKDPITIEYSLTEKGRALNRIMYELAMYSLTVSPEKIVKEEYLRQCIASLKKTFSVQ